MKTIDTVVLIAFLNPGDRLHHRSLERLEELESSKEPYVSTAALIETDIVMKLRRFTIPEREISWLAIGSVIPRERVIPNTATSLRLATALQDSGLDYFDSLIASVALENDASVITTDKEIAKHVETEW